MSRSLSLLSILLSGAALFFSSLPSDGALPRIDLFVPSEPSVASGTSVSLGWIVVDAESLSLDGVDVTGMTTVAVSPLISTTYTLTATNTEGSVEADLKINVLNAPRVIGSEARFVEVIKNNLENTRLHLSEIEVFRIGVTPDEADPDGTSSNDLVQIGTPAVVPSRTTALLDHGDADNVFDGDLERSSAVWSTRHVAGTTARYMLDLGATQPIGFVRLFGREDPCCLDRLEDVTVNLYADDSGSPGAPVNSATFTGTAPAGEAGFAELDLSLPDPSISSFTSDQSSTPPGGPVTLSWTVNSEVTSVRIDQGVGGVTAQTVNGEGNITLDPGPDSTTVYTLTAEWPGGTSQASLAVEVSSLPLIYDFTADQNLIVTGTSVSLSWNVVNATTLTLDGMDVTGRQGVNFSPGETATYTLTASNARGSESRNIRIAVVAPGEPLITEFMADNKSVLLNADNEYSDWIEIYNPTGQSASLDGYYLTDDPDNLTMWRFPGVTLAPGDYLLVFASGKNRAIPGNELHTNFNLDRDGEYLALINPDGVTVLNEFAPYPSQRPDVSYGFDAESLQEGYFTTASPGTTNQSTFTGFVADTAFSIDRGFFDDPIEVAITSSTEGSVIRYTVDGSRPTNRTGLAYTGPIRIESTTVLRAAAFKAGLVATNVDTQTYIFPADVVALPTMNRIVTAHPVYGPQMHDALKAVPSISLVFPGDVDRTEKQASVEFINFEAGSTQMDIGMERYGNYHTNFAKRSIRMNFRSEYGPAKLRFPIFDGHDYETIPPADQFDSIDLRSGNHDMQSRGAYMSNRFTDDTMLDMGNIAPHGRFVHVYLNGQYWGQYHLRERWNAAMFSEYFGGAREDYEAINANNTGGDFLSGTVYNGSGRFWSRARTLVNQPNTFAITRRYIDIPNIIDFMILWGSGNSESEFRAAGAIPRGVPFKFFIKDADGWLRGQVSGRETHQGPLGLMTRLRQDAHPDYEMLLADRIHKHFFNNGALTPGAAISRLQKRVDEIEVSFLAESARWNMQSPTSWRSYQTNLVRNTLRRLSRDMVAKYRAAGLYPSITAPTFSPGAGDLPDRRVRISAPSGEIYYTTDGTDPRAPGGAISGTAQLHDSAVTLDRIATLRARVLENGEWSALNEALFVPGQNYEDLVVSELMYNPGPASAAEIAVGHDDSEDFEFLELFNAGNTTLNLEGVRFIEGIEFDFSTGSIPALEAGQRLLLVEDRAAFEFRYGTGRPIAGQYSGQLRDEGETIQLADPLDEPIQLFTYDNHSPWPTGAAGRGSSLVLINPASLPDHNRASNWQAGALGGTPGLQNDPPLSYQAWAAQRGITDPNGDPDADGFSSLLEFNLLGNPLQPTPMDQAIRVEVTALDLGAGPQDYLTLTVRHRVTASEISLIPELSEDLVNWNEGPGAVLHSRTFHRDNSATTIYRSPNPLADSTRGYLRVRFQLP